MRDAVQTLVNGHAAAQVAALDRGLSYGDGVFRTLCVDAGAPRWWPEQFARLAADAARLGIDCPDESVWLDDLSTLQLPSHGVLRLTLTRGEGPRGYQGPAQAHPTRIVSLWPGAPAEPPCPGITVRVCDLRLGHQPALAGVKHLNRLENVLARAEWHDPEIREGILLDQDGHVVSGVTSNLFLWQAGHLRTPLLDRCGVSGVTRARLMSMAARAGHRVEEAHITLDEVHAADEVMFTNSVFLLWRVARLGERTWPKPAVSPELEALLRA